MIEPHLRQVADLRTRGHRHVAARLDRAADEIVHLRARARTLSPQSTLDRGYAVVSHADGRTVTDRLEVQVDEILRVRVARGDFAVTPVLGQPRGDATSAKRPAAKRPTARKTTRKPATSADTETKA